MLNMRQGLVLDLPVPDLLLFSKKALGEVTAIGHQSSFNVFW